MHYRLDGSVDMTSHLCIGMHERLSDPLKTVPVFIK